MQRKNITIAQFRKSYHGWSWLSGISVSVFYFNRINISTGHGYNPLDRLAGRGFTRPAWTWGWRLVPRYLIQNLLFNVPISLSTFHDPLTFCYMISYIQQCSPLVDYHNFHHHQSVIIAEDWGMKWIPSTHIFKTIWSSPTSSCVDLALLCFEFFA